MKKIVVTLITVLALGSVAAPAFAASSQACPFLDKSMCSEVAQSLSSETDN